LTPYSRYGPNYYYSNYLIAGNCISQQPDINITSLDERRSISFYQQRYPFISKNTTGAPQFMDRTVANFHLKEGSPCIDAGVPITTTRSGGSGKNIEVMDSLYFSDGMGIVDGDKVFIGANPAVRIKSVDYSSNTLVVDRTISWNGGDPVNFLFSGSAPDSGAYEFTSNTHDNTPPPES
jgi:hypothetical protein